MWLEVCRPFCLKRCSWQFYEVRCKAVVAHIFVKKGFLFVNLERQSITIWSLAL